MKPTKTELRQQFKQARLKLAEAERAAKSSQINLRLYDLVDWSSVNSLHIYEPILDLGEVDISAFRAGLSSLSPKPRLFTSRKLNGVWQIIDLEKNNLAEIPKFDVVIVPMLGFDQQLQRIGYGGGYYDKFLAGQLDAQKIGVCFELNKINLIPAEPHDIPLDIIVTETRAYQKPT